MTCLETETTIDAVWSSMLKHRRHLLSHLIIHQFIVHLSIRHLLSVPRFWHSTAAYAIATAVSGQACNLPAEGSEIYRWPGDLLQPSLVVLLTLDPEERKTRLRNRGQGKTEEEEKLDQNQLFRIK